MTSQVYLYINTYQYVCVSACIRVFNSCVTTCWGIKVCWRFLTSCRSSRIVILHTSIKDFNKGKSLEQNTVANTHTRQQQSTSALLSFPQVNIKQRPVGRHAWNSPPAHLNWQPPQPISWRLCDVMTNPPGPLALGAAFNSEIRGGIKSNPEGG